MSPQRGGVWTRLAVTLLVAIGARLAARIPLPGLDLSRIGQTDSFDATMFGILAFQLNPFLTAALLIEVLALVIPRWRPWRVGGYPERERLWARVKVAALVLASVQAFFFVRWLVKADSDFALFQMVVWSRNAPPVFIVQFVTLAAGPFLLFWLTRIIDRWGAGNGFAVILAAFMAPSLADAVASIRHRVDAGDRILLPLVVAAAVVAAVAHLAGGGSLRPGAVESHDNQLPAPSSSFYPVIASRALLDLPARFVALGIGVGPLVIAPATWTYRAVLAAVIAGLCVLLAWLFNRPRIVAEAWQRTAKPSAVQAVHERVRGAFARSLAQSLGICWGLVAVDWVWADAQLRIAAVNLAIIVCVASDVASELRFRRRRGALAAVWPVHRLYLLQGMLNALQAAGIPAFPRGRRFRTLWNFLTPYAPVDILVQAEHAERARAILAPPAPVDAGPEPAPTSGAG